MTNQLIKTPTPDRWKANLNRGQRSCWQQQMSRWSGVRT